MNTEKIWSAVETTFARRKTHPIPTLLEPPPAQWKRPFATLAEECRLKADLTQAGKNVAVLEFNSKVTRNSFANKKKSASRFQSVK